MLDLQILRNKAREAGPDEMIAVTRAAFDQIIAELEAGRRALEHVGTTFVLGRGWTL